MSTSSSTIRRSLGQYKARLLKQDNKLRGLVAQTIPTDSNECDDIKDEIELCCEEISKVITNIERRADEWQNLIDAIEDDGDREKESSLAEENASHADQGYLVVTEVALETVQSAKLRIKQIQRAMQGRNTLSADRQDVSTTKATVKLPKIQLPHFNGDHLKWAEFWSIYEANVHSRELTGTEKFSYLLSLLTGKAKDKIDGLLVSDDNYDHAVSLLKQRFEKPPQDRIASQLKKLTVSSRSNDEQRKTYDNCEKILRQLENAGENLDSNHSLVIEVLSKFPPSTIIYLQQHYKCGVNSDLPQLRNTLLKYLSEFESISETIENFKQPSNEPQTRPGSGGRYPGPNPQSGFNNPQFRFGGRNPVPPQPKGHSDFHRNPRAGPETTMTSFENQPSPCYFCKGSHFNCDCSQFPTTGERIRRLQELGHGESDKQLLEAYQNTIDYQIDAGIIEKVPASQLTKPIGPVHYLPHHPVVKPSSGTTKVRIVYDASSKIGKNAVSLNECLYRGPVILPDLCEILLRFRTGKIAITSDIEKAFLQLGLRPEDREATRFLWYKDPNLASVENNLLSYRFCRVAFGVISSPFLLGATIQHHLAQISTPVAKKIVTNVYVDNVITSTDSVAEAQQIYTESKQIFSDAGMNIQQWSSNSKELMNIIPQADQISSPETNVLGLTWNVQNDTLRLSNKRWSNFSECNTKRQILAAVSSIFDPLGFYQPAVLLGKMYLQKLWIQNLQWDEPISDELKVEWKQIHSNILPIIDNVIPRKTICFEDSDSQFSIVAFCDASMKAFATSIFLCHLNDPPKLVFAKCRLAPTKSNTMTLPRLELMGLLIGIRAADFVRRALAVNDPMKPINVHLFTDSEIAIHWIQNTKPLTRFVENRVKEIRGFMPFDLRHVRSIENPADIATRGRSGAELLSEELWWNGPPWLRESESKWPQTATSSAETSIKVPPVYHTILAGEPSPSVADTKANTEMLLGLDPLNYSSLRKLLQITTIMLKFLKRIIWDRLPDSMSRNSGVSKIFNKLSSEKTLLADDITQAKKLWIKAVQQKSCSDIFEAISKEKPHKLMQSLALELDSEGIIRSHSRFDKATVPTETKFPIFLPADNCFTKLLVEEIHRGLFHAGVAHTLSEVRQEFWIHRARQCVKKILQTCLICRRSKGPPYALPKMPPWPKARMSCSSPFMYTGLDYFGPVKVSIGMETRKLWVCLFTCLAVRAVHLEWVLDCSAQEFLNCFIRFVSRRGLPRQIVCDNASQFRVTQTITERMWDSVVKNPTVQSYAADRGVRFQFIAEFAPWQGGVWTGLVGIVKSFLKPVVGRRLLSWSDFVTVLTEAEAIVNSRPITYIYSDIESRTVILRPIDFLTDLSTTTAVGLPIDSDSPTNKLDLGDAGKRLAAYRQQKRKRLQNLWKIWYDEYLLSLRERSQSAHRGNRSRLKTNPKLDEIVIVKDEDVPRGAWKLARVVNVIQSEDGHVRSAEVLLSNGVVLRRSVKHLYPLECHQFQSNENELTDEDSEQLRLTTPQLPPATNAEPGLDDSEVFEEFDDEDILRTLEAMRQFPSSQ